MNERIIAIIFIVFASISFSGCDNTVNLKVNIDKDSSTDKVQEEQVQKEEFGDISDESGYKYKFKDGKILSIKNIDGYDVSDAGFSVDNSVYIQINPKGYVATGGNNFLKNVLISVEVLEKSEKDKYFEEWGERNKANKLYTPMELFMNRFASTQCYGLKDDMFSDVEVGADGLKVSFEKHCDWGHGDFGRDFNENPVDMGIHMIGFDLNEHTVIIKMATEKENIPVNPDELLLNIAKQVEIR